MQAQITPANYRDIGMAVYKMQPELAIELLALAKKVSKPKLQDISFIASFYDHYKNFVNFSEIVTGRKKSEYKKTFIAAIIKLYNPELLSAIHTYNMKRNLRSELSLVLDIYPTQVTRVCAEVCVHMKIYPDFKASVDELAQVLLSKVPN